MLARVHVEPVAQRFRAGGNGLVASKTLNKRMLHGGQRGVRFRRPLKGGIGQTRIAVEVEDSERRRQTVLTDRAGEHQRQMRAGRASEQNETVELARERTLAHCRVPRPKHRIHYLRQ